MNHHYFSLQHRFLITVCSIFIMLFGFSDGYAAQSHENSPSSNTKSSHLSYQSASKYGHLNWVKTVAPPVAISLLPIVNNSGIPLQERQEKTEYYEHGNIPLSVNLLFSGLANASGYFSLKNENSEYQLQLSIDSYRHPFSYAPDDSWYQTQTANVDRWLVEPQIASVSLSLKIISNRIHRDPWIQTVQTTLGQCDLNQNIQPLPDAASQNKTLRAFTQSSPGQAFVAASNYLILQAIQYINQQSKLAQVVRKNGNELFLLSRQSTFNQGDKLGVYPNDSWQRPSALPMGTIQIIKSYNHQAVAYPVDINPGHIKEGDWVELNSHYPYPMPKSVFSSKNHCAAVGVATL